MATLTELKSKRGQLKATITRTRNYFESIDQSRIDSKTITEINIRLSKIEPLLDEFNNVQLEIEHLCKEMLDYDETIDENERYTFEQNYYSLLTDMKHLMTLNNTISNIQSVQTTSPSSQSQLLQQIKLPTISLPNFDGQYNEWVEFRDCFNALINDNVALTKIQKFYYLRSSLRKEALQIIESLQVSAENYDIAWKLLNERFEQKSLIIHSHVKAIFDYPCLTKENHSELRKLFDTITKHLRSLKTLGQPTDKWDTLVIYIITSKMDSVTRREWELFKKRIRYARNERHKQIPKRTM
ncbi:hypothetical protein NQ317_017084 [Molorchus minor]|uniref:Uncharacterized protein n=1 Tax=Molorchus minor TaxID=1323400 RepID=A0ABQ9K602_9CUCU|nr:hypothetical protein NQ317_017084 [Molorchus minor]